MESKDTLQDALNALEETLIYLQYELNAGTDDKFLNALKVKAVNKAIDSIKGLI